MPPSTATPSRRVRSIEPQKIREMYELASDIDDELVHLEFGEPDFDTPEHIVSAAAEAARDGKTKYTSNAGIRPLREELAGKMEREFGRPVDPSTEITVTNGGVEAMFLAIAAIADPGDEFVIPSPTWPNAFSQCEFLSIKPVEVPLSSENGFSFDAERITSAIGPETAGVLLTTPSNPTGQLISEDAIESVIDAAVRVDATVVIDEVYRELCYGNTPRRVASVTDHPEAVLTVDSFSKVYAMTGWRIGWLTGPSSVIEHVTKTHESTTSCVNTPTQYGAIAALTGPQEPIERMKQTFERRREYVVDRIDAMPSVSLTPPDGTFYAFVDITDLPGTSMEVAKRLLYEHHVVTAPGIAFGSGGEGYLRLSFATDMTSLEEGLDRIESMIRSDTTA